MQERNSKPNVIFRIMLLMVLGVLFGTLAFSFIKTSTLSDLNIVENDYLSMRENGGYIKVLYSSLLNSSLLMVVLFLLGFCAIAQPVAVLVPVYKGLGFGATIAQIYFENGFHGFFTALIMILPSALVSSYALFIGVRESLRLSNRFFSQAFLNRRSESDSLNEYVKLYAVKFLVLEAVTAVSAAVDCLSSLVYNMIK